MQGEKGAGAALQVSNDAADNGVKHMHAATVTPCTALRRLAHARVKQNVDDGPMVCALTLGVVRRLPAAWFLRLQTHAMHT